MDRWVGLVVVTAISGLGEATIQEPLVVVAESVKRLGCNHERREGELTLGRIGPSRCFVSASPLEPGGPYLCRTGLFLFADSL